MKDGVAGLKEATGVPRAECHLGGTWQGQLCKNLAALAGSERIPKGWGRGYIRYSRLQLPVQPRESHWPSLSHVLLLSEVQAMRIPVH